LTLWQNPKVQRKPYQKMYVLSLSDKEKKELILTRSLNASFHLL